MALVEMETSDVVFLRKAAEVMRQGRASELISELWPRGLEELASQVAWQLTLEAASSKNEAVRKARAQRNREVHKA